MLWLGEKRGNLSDWTTQQWVRATGRQLPLASHLWLDGPVGGTREIGKHFFERYAATHGFEVVEGGIRGLIPDFSCLEEGNGDLALVAPQVRDFYERTSEYDLDAWSEWSAAFRLFGKVLSLLFSSRLQQLNVPLSSLDTAKGMTSRVVQMRRPQSASVSQTAWIRELKATDNVLYAGLYSACMIPGHPSPCVKVVFPLPNGNAIVIMKLEANADGSLSLKSIGDKFGDPGFYFVVHDGAGKIVARYVRSFKEVIRVYGAASDTVRADHTLWIWGIEFLRLHYRMRRIGSR